MNNKERMIITVTLNLKLQWQSHIFVTIVMHTVIGKQVYNYSKATLTVLSTGAQQLNGQL